MNIVFLTQRVPHPPDRGDRIATSNYLRHFWQRGDKVRIGCLSSGPGDDAGIAWLRERAVEVCAPRSHEKLSKIMSLRGLLSGVPLTLTHFADRRLRRTVDRWLAEDPPDVVFVYSSSMAQYVLGARRAHRIMFFAELDSDKWRQYAARASGPGRWIYAREARLLLAFEQRIARSFDASVVVSDVEKELFLAHIPDVEPHVIQNGVDVAHFTSQGDATRHPHTAVFTGIMDYEPNVDGMRWFVAESWPLVRARFQDARLLIVGNRPAPSIKALDGKDGVTVTGWVESTTPWFDRAAVGIAPLRLARGLQNKVLEAMSMALPVVATTHAAQGLGPVPADTLVVRDSAEDVAAAVVHWFGDAHAARAVGLRAAAFVRARFQWSNTWDLLDRLLARARRTA